MVRPTDFPTADVRQASLSIQDIPESTFLLLRDPAIPTALLHYFHDAAVSARHVATLQILLGADRSFSASPLMDFGLFRAYIRYSGDPV